MVGWRRDIWRAVARGLGALAVLLLAFAAQAGLEDGRYGVAQVFDVRRTPSLPVPGQNFRAWMMARPFYSVPTKPTFSPYTLASNEYIRFVRVGTDDNPCKFAIHRYGPGDAFIEEISSPGPVYGLAAEGFLHIDEDRDYGTFVANAAGYANGGEQSFITPIAAATCAQAAAYAANETPLNTVTLTLVSSSVLTPTDSGATLRATANLAATGYWVVVPAGAAAPSVAEIRAGQAAGGAAPAAHGSGAMAAGAIRNFSVMGLVSGTGYEAYVVADNGSTTTTRGGPHAFTTTLAPVAGVCTTVSQPVVAAPTGTAACVAGTRANPTSSAAMFGWQCSGIDGGATATCSAPRGYTVTSSAGAGGSVTPSGSQVVAYNGTANFALSATAGHVLSAASGCSGSLGGTLGTSTAANYTTGPVSADCAASFAFAANALPTVGGLSIAGGSTAAQGVPLTGSYLYQDADNDAEGTSLLQWKRALSAAGPGTPIAGATGAQYTPTAADAGQYLFFCVTPMGSTGLPNGAEVCTVVSSPVRVDGVCGTATALEPAIAPASALCSAGTPGAVSVLGGQYTWVCRGQFGGSDIAGCQAPWSPTGAGPRGTVTREAASDDWRLVSASFSGTPPADPPAGVQFPAGILSLQLSSGLAGSSTSVTVHYTEALPRGTVYMKYGPSPEGMNCRGDACAQPHWYRLPSARAVFAADRRSVTLTLQDGGVGDSDRQANSWIDDPGGPALLPPTDPMAIPTLSEWGMLLLSAALGLGAAAVLRRRRL